MPEIAVGDTYECIIGRGDRIRTCDPLVPNQVLYQAEPLPDRGTAEVARNPRGVNSRGSLRGCNRSFGRDRLFRGDGGDRALCGDRALPPLAEEDDQHRSEDEPARDEV